VYALDNLDAGDAKKMLSAMKSTPDAPVSSILSDKVIAGNPSLYGKGEVSAKDAYGRMGNFMRAVDAYANDARQAAGLPVIGVSSLPKIAMAGIQSVANIPPVTGANVPSAVPSAIPAAPDVAAIPAQLNSAGGAGAGRGFVNVAAPEQIGQNVGDRATAHIVTGGMGSVG